MGVVTLFKYVFQRALTMNAKRISYKRNLEFQIFIFPNLTQFQSSWTRKGKTLQYFCRSSHVGCMEIKLHTHYTETGLLMQVSGVIAREIILSIIALALIT